MRGKLALLLALALAGCGNSREQADIKVSLQALRQIPGLILGRQAPPDPAAIAQVRQALEADGKPAINISLPALKYATLMVPYYPSKDGAMTWANGSYETVTLRQGVLVWTRGLGPDLMASQGPDLAQISSASGSVHRIYEYLDGGDQPQQYDYDCDFSPGGPAQVAVLGLVYDTRLVIEDCSKGADRFQNRYWFDKGGKIRQSEQLLAPGAEPMLLQHVID